MCSSPAGREGSAPPASGCSPAEGAHVVVHYHRGRERAEAAGGHAVVQADLTERGRGGADVRRGGRARRLRGRRGRLAGRRRSGLGAAARALAGDRRREPDRDLPDGPRLPRRARRPPGLTRARRLDGRALRRGRPRRLRGREVGDPLRPAALAEERGRAPQPGRARERGRARLDRVADDRAESSTTTACAGSPARWRSRRWPAQTTSQRRSSR